MVKKSSTRKLKFNKLWLAVAILFLLQVTMAWYIFKYHNEYLKSTEGNGSRAINTSEKEKYLQPVISVSENRVYIPEVRIFLPLNDTTRKLLYLPNTLGSKDNSVIFLDLSLRGVVGNQNDTDHFSCDRMVTLTAKPGDMYTYGEPVGEIASVKDGLRYISRNERECKIYPSGSLDELVNAAKAIQKY